MTLINSDLITDLGIEVDSDLSYHAHIVSIHIDKATYPACWNPISRLFNMQLKIHAQRFHNLYTFTLRV